jgi:hypothetical protein
MKYAVVKVRKTPAVVKIFNNPKSAFKFRQKEYNAGYRGKLMIVSPRGILHQRR